MATLHIGIKSGKPGSAAMHAKYIAREGTFGRDSSRDDLLHVSIGNFPPGFHGPSEFWKAADRGERINGAVYRELVMALPRELDTRQHIEIVEEFIDREIPGKPYVLAIHCPNAALDGKPQPHAHLMYSDRVPDGLYREPEAFFRRYNAKYPARGGAKKDSGGDRPSAMSSKARQRRENWAELTNEHLQKHGFDATLDARSNVARGIHRLPETHLGPALIRAMTAGEKASVTASRAEAAVA